MKTLIILVIDFDYWAREKTVQTAIIFLASLLFLGIIINFCFSTINKNKKKIEEEKAKEFSKVSTQDFQIEDLLEDNTERKKGG